MSFHIKYYLIAVLFIALLSGCVNKKTVKTPVVENVTGELMFPQYYNTSRKNMIVSLIQKEPKVSLITRENCQKVMTFELILSNLPRDDYSKFRKSMRGSDLKLEEILSKAKDITLKECKQLTVIRVVETMLRSSRDEAYKGTYAKENNWQLEDGFTQYSIVKGSVSNTNIWLKNGLAIFYRGVCNDIQQVILERKFRRPVDRDFAKRLSWGDLNDAMKVFIEAYKTNCPQTQNFEFKLSYIPIGYRCVNGQQTCTVRTTDDVTSFLKPINSTIEVIRTVKVMALSYKEIIEYLETDDLEKIPNDTVFAKFHNGFIGVYSEHCQSSINDPVTRVHQPIKEITHSDGSITRRKDGEPRACRQLTQ